ncbi:MAG: BamA/TamA family outer membrane protein [Gammaproteobacteria bacterium]|nr:BamA/TamA family outer membrane protein [Gammaproteobacteria bacterium]
MSLLFVQPLAAADENDAVRLKIGVVLGGGGARGAAHVGVLKIMEDLRIPVDYIVGTSMGSIVAGLSASGMSSAEIKQTMITMDWNDVFDDDPPRADRSFRRKRDDDLYTIDAAIGVHDGEFDAPFAVIHGQKFNLTLNRLMLPVATVRDFDELSIPFRAVATDLETGGEVVLGHGNLANSVRASMGVPAAFDPVEIDGRLLADGGMVNNVPVSVARAMGAEVLIVVNVSSPLLTRDNIKNALDISGQLGGFLTLNVQQQLDTLDDCDVLITPQLGDITGGSFDRVADAISVGETAAQGLRESLARYSLSPAQYAAHLEQRPQFRKEAPMIDFIRIINHTAVGDDIIADRISAQPGQPLDVKQLEADIGRVYGLEIFETVNYEIVEEDGKTGLVITANEKSWGPGYIQGGISAANNFEGESNFQLGIVYTQTEINELNGEWRTGLQLGDEPGIFTELYQPLDSLSRYFVSGKVIVASENINEFDNDGNNISTNRLKVGGIELSIGREFGTWGEGRFGYRRATGNVEVKTGPQQPDYDVDRGEIFLSLFADKFDSLNFPRKGYLSKVEYSSSREGYGASADYDQWLFGYSQALTWSKNTVVGTIAAATTEDDDAPLEGLFQLGGFLLISGLAEDQLSGQHVGIVRLIYYRRLSDDGFLRLFDTYLGASLESGNAWQDKDDISFDNTITAGSLFLGYDTPVGPLYLGYGATDTDEQSMFIFLGPRFSF